MVGFAINEENVENGNVDDEDNEVSNLEDLRQKLQLYLKTMEGTGSPRVMELFKELNETLENPDSETKHTVSIKGYVSELLITILRNNIIISRC